MMLKKWHSALLFALLITMNGNGLAETTVKPMEKNSFFIFHKLIEAFKSAGVASLSIGPVWEHVGNTQTFYLTPAIEKSYVANDVSHTLVNGEFFLGIQKPLQEKLDGQIGLVIATTSHAPLSGTIWDDANPLFNNYSYHYQVTHHYLALKTKLGTHGDYFLTPWMSGSIGIGFNQAYHFSNTPMISEAVIMPNFVSHTTTAFSYTLGIGIEHHLNSHWQAGLGYEFADWGKTLLNAAAGQTVNDGLALSHLYTNGFLFTFTYHV